MVTLNRNDLSHILSQILIAEEHTRLTRDEGMDPGEALAQLVTSPLLPTGLRTVDGTFNNFQPGMTHFGSADQAMLRLLTPEYGTAEPSPFGPPGPPTSYESTSGTVFDSQPRVISNLVADQTLANPAAIAAALQVNGVTGAAQLAVVQEITAAYQAALAARAAAEAGGPAVDPAVVAALQAARDAAQLALDGAEAQLADASADKAATDAAVEAAAEALASAQAALDALGPSSTAVADAQAAVAAATTALTAAIAAASDAADVLALAEADLAVAQQALADAVTVRDEAAASEADANAAIITAQQALALAEEALQATNGDPAALAAAASAVAEAGTALAAAQSTVEGTAAALAIAIVDVTTAQAVVASAQQAVTQAQGEKDAADAAAAAAQAELVQAEADLALAQEAATTAQALALATPTVANINAWSAAVAAADEAEAARDAALQADADADALAAESALALDGSLAALAQAEGDLQAVVALRDEAVLANDAAVAAVGAAQTALDVAEAALLAEEQAQQDYTDALALRDLAAADLAAREVEAEDAAAVTAAAEEAVTAAADAVSAAQAVTETRAAEKAAADATVVTAGTAVTDAAGVLGTALAGDAARAAAIAAVVEAETGVAEAAAAQAEAAVVVTDATQAVTDAEAALAAAEAEYQQAAEGDLETVALQAEAALDAALVEHGITLDGENVYIRNVAADLGDTASFNGFMTIFGQFFDHGLDLTTKGGSGTVMIPLHPDDPLYDPSSPTNFMVLTRATNDPGADGILGTADDVRDHRNETTPWIDLNQVYTSNASHQVFLREYIMVEGKPLATGHMLEGAKGGPPTWADIKAQAREMLGIELGDLNVNSVPLLVTDLYGEFVRGTNGLPQMMTAAGAVEGNLDAPISGLSALTAGRGFLNDIAHAATPSATAAYDAELLDAHYIVGDGRGNENIALTAVHTVFHGEHNRQVDEIKAQLLQPGEEGAVDIAFLNQWLLVDVTEVPADTSTLVWDGERLFQAARFSTEMVYQHLVFEEFVRAVAPQIDPFVFSHTVELNGAIYEEFAQVVYRFGHSMLNEQVEMLKLVNDSASPEEIGLIEAFLNPLAFDGAGVDAAAAAGAILRGMSRQTGNEIDEFTTSALRNNLVGLPLDLAALNMTRARETGIPSLNDARREIFEKTNDTYLKPYESWADYAQNLKNPMSVINFIAAYGTHATITGATTLAEKRAAATDLVFGAAGETAAERTERLDFLNSTGSWAGTESGLNDVDFWIGGLAEALMPFGGMLGSTFTFVFESQIQNLQNGDRFYYLSRAQGMNLLTELESDSFADLIRRNTDTEESGIHINGAAFQSADYIIEMNQALQYNPGLGSDDPTREADVISAIAGTPSLVIRRADYLQYTGGEHVVLGGTDRAETIIGGAGDDGIWGEGGDDRIEGGYGVDHVHGGEGNDIITDSGTDVGGADVLKGEGGDDIINGGMGIDLVFGGEGNDLLAGGSEAKDIFGGTGNDFIRAASGGGGMILGNEGHDWMEGQGNMNTLTGDNSELFFNSRVIGHDVMLSGENDTDFDAESGDDIMVQGIGVNRNNGMAGFDWVSYQGNNYAANADLNVSIFVNQQNNILRDRYDLVEGLSGWNHDDVLTGREVVVGAYDADGNAAQIAADAPVESFSNVLLEKNLSLISGLSDLVAHLERFDVTHPGGTTTEVLRGVMDTSDGSDIILGGGGSDLIRGMAGNDILDGDKWLSVHIAVKALNGTVLGTAARLTSQVLDSAGNALFGGKTLEAALFARDLMISQLEAVREILDGGEADDEDVAVYWDVRDNYEVTANEDGSITVTHATVTAGVTDPATGKNLADEGSDRLFNFERVRFGDGEFTIADLLNEAPVITSPDSVSVPENGTAVLTVTATDADGDGVTYALTGGADAALFTIDPATGVLSFVAPPDFEAPADAGADNLYEVEVSVSDGIATTTQQLGVTVTNGNDPTSGAPAISDLTPTETQAISVSLAGVTDPDGIGGTAVQWQRSSDNGATWTNIALATGLSYTPQQADAGNVLRASVTVTDLLGNPSVLLAPATGIVGDSINGTAAGNSLNGNAGSDILNGNGGADTISGNDGDDTISGGTGNDVINAGAGDDTVVWNAALFSNDGRDIVNGGTETTAGDTYIINGSDTAETFRVYTRVAYLEAGSPNGAIAAGTEIVVTRQAPLGANTIIAELSEIEEIVINTNGGGLFSDNDSVTILGDFGGTSLNYNTITINGTDGSDQVDISGLDSAHRILFRTGGGQDTIIGTLRAQDVIEAPAGADPASYLASQNPTTGLITLTAAGSSISFVGSLDALPQIVAYGTGDDHVAEEEDGAEQPSTDDDVTDEAETGEDTAEEDDNPGHSTEEDEDSTEEETDDTTEDDTEEEGTGDTDGATDPAVPVPVMSRIGTEGADTLAGSAGDDFLAGGGGHDIMAGGAGADVLLGEGGRDAIEGNDGDDVIEGGAGDDALFGGAGDDTFLALEDDGRDLMFGGEGRDTLDLSAILSDVEIDLGSLSAIGWVKSGGTTDRLVGVENAIGGAGNDVFRAGTQANTMAGGEGDDIFRFDTAASAEGDAILDFSPGDMIDLSGIDAMRGMSGNQSFRLASADEAPAAGLLLLAEGEGDTTLVTGHTDGDGVADFTLTVQGRQSLNADSFTL